MMSAKFSGFWTPSPPCQYQIHATSPPLVRNWLTPSLLTSFMYGPFCSLFADSNNFKNVHWPNTCRILSCLTRYTRLPLIRDNVDFQQESPKMCPNIWIVVSQILHNQKYLLLRIARHTYLRSGPCYTQILLQQILIKGTFFRVCIVQLCF